MSARVRSLLQHPGSRVEPHQPPGVPRLACHVQEGAGAASDVEHRLGCQDHWQIEPEVVALLRRAELVIERRLFSVGEAVPGSGLLDFTHCILAGPSWNHRALRSSSGLYTSPVDVSQTNALRRALRDIRPWGEVGMGRTLAHHP